VIDPKTILVIKLKPLGDVLLSTPAIHALKMAYPRARIHMLVSRGTEDMLAGNPDLASVIPFAKPGGRGPRRWREELRLLRALRALGPDLVVEMGKGDREAILGYLSGARWRVGFDAGRQGLWGRNRLLTHRAERTGREHIVEGDLKLVEALGIAAADTRLRLHLGVEDAAAADRLLAEGGVLPEHRLVTVHPTSKWLFKCWRDEGMAAVIDHLAGRGLRVVLTSGPAPREAGKARRILGMARSPVVDLIGRLTLKQLAAVIGRSCLFLGVDSAPMHIAAAMGTPVVALFGPSGEHNWRPWGEGHVVVAKDLFCRPCGQDGCNGSKRSDCLDLLTEAEVIAAVDGQLARHGLAAGPAVLAGAGGAGRAARPATGSGAP
jgi:heptosyltransferase-3